MEKERFKQGVELTKERKAEIEAINNNNYDWMKAQSTTYWGNLNDDQKENFKGASNFAFQYAQALQYVKGVSPDVVWDLEGNVDQQVAFNTQFEKWLADKLHGDNYGQGVPSFKTYMQDAFIKTRMEGDSILSLADTNPSIGDLRDLNINVEDINWKDAKEYTNQAYQKIKTYSEGYNEKNTLALMAKDYNDFRKHLGESKWKDFKIRAGEEGVGAFIWYVSTQVEDGSHIGTMYDPATDGMDLEQKTDYVISWLAQQAALKEKSQTK